MELEKFIFVVDHHFTQPFHMDFYNFVILAPKKKHPILHQRWIDWVECHDMDDPDP